jgi:hypothetical protein
MIGSYKNWRSLFEEEKKNIYTLADRPNILYRIGQDKWQYQQKTATNKNVWHWVTNLVSVNALNKKYGKNLLVHVDRPEAKPITDSEKISIINQIKKTGSNLGWTENAIAAVIGNVGRENAFNWKYLIGPHSDPKTKATNFGIISWQGSRLDSLKEFLKKSGLLQKNGSAKKDLRSIDSMLRFMDSELDSQGGDSKLMRNQDATTSQVSDMLKKYIRYAMAPYNTPDPKFNVEKNHIWAASAKLSGLINYI